MRGAEACRDGVEAASDSNSICECNLNKDGNQGDDRGRGRGPPRRRAASIC
jgi:hypothetical protein